MDRPLSTLNRIVDLQRFYELLGEHSKQVGGDRLLSECSGRLEWPARGVYFFFEPGEMRTDSGSGARVVRVGTHALKPGSRTSLWNRLSQHRGALSSGRGNHRGSIFRLLIGAALLNRDQLRLTTWGSGSSAPREIRELEQDLEREVSRTLASMRVRWLAVEDDSGPGSLRGVIERNAIALLSNAGREAIDRPSDQWLGLHCPRELVRASGLWNQKHVSETYDPAFLDLIESHVTKLKVTA
ncbi:MAG: hypothetical protein WD942_02720 [Dehalococcoidia bacterium]